MRARFSRAGGGRLGFRIGLLAVVGAIGLVACTPDPIVIPVRNLERPADMGFVCVEKVDVDGGASYVTGRPMSVCHDPVVKATPNDTTTDRDPTSSRAWRPPATYGTYGLISNTARGEVAVVDFDYDKLVDLAPGTPGYNQVPVGALPEAIAVSSDGCRAATANRGTCDLSLLDTSQLLAKRFGVPGSTAATQVPIATSVRIKGDSGDLRAQPREIAFLPKAAPAECSAGTAPGMTPTGEVVVTFPRCGLVAIVHLPDGHITSSVRVLADGTVVNAGTDPVCPVECGGGITRDGGTPPLPADGAAADPDGGAVDGADSDAGASDAEAADGGTLVDLGPGNPALPPVDARAVVAGLAIMPDASKLYFGMADAPILVSVGVAADAAGSVHQLIPLGGAGKLGLVEGAIGITKVRLSVDPFITPAGGRFVGTRGQFVYAFARDGSIRVVRIGPAGPANGRECDTNVDLYRMPGRREDGCIGVDEKLERNLLAVGPGLRLPRSNADVAPAVPIDIAFGEVEGLATGFLLASTGQVLHVGLGLADFRFSDFTGVTTPVDRAATHAIRRAPTGFANSAAGDVPTVSTEPTRNFSTTDVPFATKVAFQSHLDGLRVESFVTTLTSGSTPQTVWSFFPREQSVPPGTVDVVWEGPLSGTVRANGRLEVPTQAPGDAGALSDVGANFCRAGVRTGDIVSLIGCDQDARCDILRDQVCHKAAPGAPGVCVPRAFISDEAKVRACRAEFASRRRYEVKEASAHRLVLGTKLDEVPQLGVAPCTVDPRVCQPDAAHQADPRLGASDHGFSCQALARGPRCVKTCGVAGDDGVVRPNDALCRPGHVCADVGEAVGPLCVEAPPPRSECLVGELPYQVQMGRSFFLRAGWMPQLETEREESPGGRCVPIEGVNPRLVDRISLDAPACAASPADVTGAALGDFIRRDPPGPANPCVFTGLNTDNSADLDTHWKMLVEGADQRFVLTNVEKYLGDAALIELSVTGGFVPLRALSTRSGADAVLGVRILTSPMVPLPEGTSRDTPVPPYFFVIDQGRTLSDLSRGQLLRLNPRSVSTYYGGYFDSLSTNSYYPIQ
jgi:hypothetical protein